ncbi:MAG: superoxide dismutase [Phycisphaeraceae bacterium]|nr:superoxide dismutase [Phycisphaeraceae bacterium]
MTDPITRRQAIASLATGAAALSLAGCADKVRSAPGAGLGVLVVAGGPLTLPDLPYAHDALEPFIDTRTMEIHHGKHHKAYVDNANKALDETMFKGEPAEEILAAVGIAKLPDATRAAIRNNVGGHYNHALFWSIMAPAGKGGGGAPSGPLAGAIAQAFGSFDAKGGFKERFAAAGAGRFGSGWAWLCVTPDRALAICSTANQDSPLMGQAVAGCSGTPILGLDVWEHAYYLKYQNLRADYIAAWWNVVNWAAVADRYAAALAAPRR